MTLRVVTNIYRGSETRWTLGAHRRNVSGASRILVNVPGKGVAFTRPSDWGDPNLARKIARRHPLETYAPEKILGDNPKLMAELAQKGDWGSIKTGTEAINPVLPSVFKTPFDSIPENEVKDCLKQMAEILMAHSSVSFFLRRCLLEELSIEPAEERPAIFTFRGEENYRSVSEAKDVFPPFLLATTVRDLFIKINFDPKMLLSFELKTINALIAFLKNIRKVIPNLQHLVDINNQNRFIQIGPLVISIYTEYSTLRINKIDINRAEDSQKQTIYLIIDLKTLIDKEPTT